MLYSFGHIPITGERLQIWTFAWHVWPLSSGGSLPCNLHFHTGNPFIMVISQDPYNTHAYCRVVGSGAVLPVLTTKVRQGYDSKNQPSTYGANALTEYATAAA